MTPFSYKRSFINPQTKKKDYKTEWTSNAAKREDFIKKFGEKRFNELAKDDERLAELQPLSFPEGFTWLSNHFFKIWRHCETDINGNKIFTPKQILDYCECFGVYMTYPERFMILKMKEWAVEAIAELKEEKEKDDS